MQIVLELLTQIALIIGILLSISAIIIVHELGHYWAARLNKLYAVSVSIGLAKYYLATPIAIRQNGNRAWPLGGYVDLAGNISDKHEQYQKLSYLQKTCILMAGICSNLLLALVLLTSTTYVGFERQTYHRLRLYKHSST